MRVLIVKLAAIGDVIMATAMIPALRRLHPDAHLTWVVGHVARPLLAEIPGIDTLIAIDEKALLTGGLADRLRVLAGVWRQLAGKTFDLVVVAHHDRRYGLLTLGTRARLRRNFWDDPARALIRGRHHSHDYARLITGIDGPHAVPGAVPRLSPPLPPSLAEALAGSGGLALLAPGGARNTMRDSPMRRWPVESYRALAETLLARGLRVGLIGAPGDTWVRESFQGLDVIDLVGRTSLPELVAVMARADVVVTHDSMSAHMPRLAGVPAVALFGPTNPGDFAYPEPGWRILWGGETLACRPCYDGREFAACDDNRCMKQISVDAVARAVDAVLEKAGAATAGND